MNRLGAHWFSLIILRTDLSVCMFDFALVAQCNR